MIRLIVDYYRRWSLVLAIGAVPLLILGWSIMVEPRTPIEFIVALLPIWILHLLDQSRGAVRLLSTLPLTPRQIGRSWWLANVPLPAIMVAALLFAGAGGAELFASSRPFPLHRLLLANLFALIWLGTVFVLFVPASSQFNNRWQHIFATLFIALLTVGLTFWMVTRAVSSLSGFFLPHEPAKSPDHLFILAGGVFLIFVGWFRAERFNPARSQFCRSTTDLSAKFYATKPSAHSPPRTSPSSAPHQPPEGCGGILFLLRISFIRGLYACLAGAIGALFVAGMGSGFAAAPSLTNLREGFKPNDPAITILLIFILFPLQRSMLELRFLRTMPISTAKLAGVIISSVILPVLTISLLMAGITGLSLGTPAGLRILKSCLLGLSPMALCVFFTIWRGGGIEAYVLFLLALMAWALVVSASQNIMFALAGGIAVAGVMLAWLLTYYALLRARRAYRVQTNPLGNYIWSMRR